ncbi:MAG TPA: MFS transporter [Gammaproteobacteria bacterium]
MSGLPERTRWGVVLLAVSAGMIAGAHIGKAPPALPQLREELGLGLVTGGWVVSMFNATGAVLGIVAGSIGDRVGTRRVVLWGFVALALGGLLGAASDSVAALLASRFLEGLGFITVAVTTPGLIVAATRVADLRLALGAWSTYMPGGSAAAMVLAPLLLDGVGWRGLWVAVALVCVLWMALLLRYAPPDPPAHQRLESKSLRRNVRLTVSRPGPWLLALAFGGYTVQWVSLMVWLPTFLVEQRGVAVSTAALLTALIVACNVPGNLFGGWLLHRHLPRWLLLALSGVGTGGCLFVIFDPGFSDALRLACCLAFTVLGGMLPPAVLSGPPVVAPGRGQIGTTNGMLIQGSNIGQVIGPPLAALMVTLSGSWESGFWVLEAAAFLVVAAAWAYRGVERRLLAAPPPQHAPG